MQLGTRCELDLAGRPPRQRPPGRKQSVVLPFRAPEDFHAPDVALPTCLSGKQRKRPLGNKIWLFVQTKGLEMGVRYRNESPRRS